MAGDIPCQDGATEASSEASSADRIAALRWAGEIAGLLGDPAAAEARLSESLALARRVGDKRGIAAALGAIGSALFQHVDVARSIAPFTEAVDLSRELGDLRQTAFLQAFLGGAIAHQGDLARGDALVAESAEMLRVTRRYAQLRSELRLDGPRLDGRPGRGLRPGRRPPRRGPCPRSGDRCQGDPLGHSRALR